MNDRLDIALIISILLAIGLVAIINGCSFVSVQIATDNGSVEKHMEPITRVHP